MHGRSFKILNTGSAVTIWGASAHRGIAGVVVGKEGEPRKGRGKVIVRLPTGIETKEPFEWCAIGDNGYVSLR